MTLDEELKEQLEESKRHNLNEFCGTCVRSSMCCDQCQIEAIANKRHWKEV